jgi:hypothetical protein
MLGQAYCPKDLRASEVEALKLRASEQTHHLGFASCLYPLGSSFDAKPPRKRYDRVHNSEAFTLTGGRSPNKGFVNFDLGK